MSLLGRLVFFVMHSALHVVGYLIPRYGFHLQWRLICRVVRLLKRSPPAPGERDLRIVAASNRDIVDAFGLGGLWNPPAATGIPVPSPLRLRYTAPLYNQHLNTILGAVQPVIRLHEMEREMLPSYDGNRLCLDWAYPPGPREKVRGLLLMLPGITGNSDASYVQRLLKPLMNKGIAVVVLNPRGALGTPLDQPRLYCALYTEDIRFVLQHPLHPDRLAERFRRVAGAGSIPVVACGFSMGGLIVCHYVTEQAKRDAPTGLVGVLTVTSPLNIHVSNQIMNEDRVSYWLYNYPLSLLIRKTVKPHLSVLADMPGVDTERVFKGSPTEPPLLDKIRSVRDFDDIVTGPHFGYRDAEHYYTSANVIDRLHHSKTPTLCLAAQDDPICGKPVAEEYQQVAAAHGAGLVMVELPRGGHLGFMMSPLDFWRQVPNPMETLLLHAVNSFLQQIA